MLSIWLFEIDAPEPEILFFWFALVNPLFIYCVSFVFDNEGLASVLLRLFYFILGGIAPIAIQVLVVINARCIEIGGQLKEWFIFAPIFNLNYAYLNIVNRKIIARLGKKDPEAVRILDWEVTGRYIFILQCFWVFLLILLALFELEVFAKILRPVEWRLRGWMW